MEKFGFGLGVMGIGLIVVFVGLIILIAFIKILTAITTALNGEKKKPATQPEAKPAAEAPVSVSTAADAGNEGIPAEVIAAITAAVASVLGTQTGFAVRHVKRIANAPAWNRAGREEQTYSRF